MEKQDFIPLVDRYLKGTASDAEKTLLEEYYKRLEAKGATELNSSEEARLKSTIYDRLAAHSLSGGDGSARRRNLGTLRATIYRLTAAAAAITIIIASWWLFIKKEKIQPVNTVATKQIMPGRDAAVLTLADGKTIYLDSVTGKVNESAINANGLLTYAQNNSDEVQYHTLTTSRGNQYKIILPDGSKLMLNSATSIKFPSAFINNKREIALIYGEAYFEVAPDKLKPFIVDAGENKIQVLGTSFNINNYKDETAQATTLVTGSVKISGKGSEKLLIPGQQAVFTNNEFKITEVDIAKTIAWTTGFFEFDKMDLRSVLRQISRWYDIDIIYSNTYPSDARFGGRISRNLPLSNILKLLEANGIKFKLEGKQLIIM